MSAPSLKIFIPLVPVRPDEKELVPLFASDNEKRMEAYSRYLKRFDRNRYLLNEKLVSDIYTLADLRIRCPNCGTVMTAVSKSTILSSAISDSGACVPIHVAPAVESIAKIHWPAFRKFAG